MAGGARGWVDRGSCRHLSAPDWPRWAGRRIAAVLARETIAARPPLRPPAQTRSRPHERRSCCLGRLRCPALDKLLISLFLDTKPRCMVQREDCGPRGEGAAAHTGQAGRAVLALVAGCGGGSATSTAASTPSSTNLTTTTTAAATTTTTLGAMTGDELVWLEGIRKLHTKADKVLSDAPSSMTSSTMGTLAAKMRSCSRELARLGAPTERLRPVYKLAKQGCAQYDKAAGCFATAASIGAPLAGTAEERRFNQALDCGFAAPGKGSLLLANAEAKGFEIKETTG